VSEFELVQPGATLPASAFRSGVPIALGTDSGESRRETDLLDELRVARSPFGTQPGILI
jgi:cytosine/adenosine deaminase-related metal-dependent hydrolase